LKKLDLATGEPGAAIFTAPVSIDKVKTDRRSQFACCKLERKITRVDLTNGESSLVAEVAKGNMIYDFQVGHLPAINGDILIISADRDEGLFIYNLQDMTQMFSRKWGAKEDLFSQAVVQRLNYVISGCISGLIRIIDCKAPEIINSADTDVVVDTVKLDSAVRCMAVSQLPEEKFIAFGTDRGNVHVYEVDNLIKGFKYSEFRTHDQRISQMQFLERGDDFMIITASNDGHVAVHCLKENILLHKFKFAAKIFQVAVKDDRIVARAAGYKLY